MEQKIRELEAWLEDNPTHQDRALIESDLRKLKEQLNESGGN